MATATYTDFMTRYPSATAAQATVEAFLDDVAAEISARAVKRGTSYEQIAIADADLVKRVECAACWRMCGKGEVGGYDANALQSYNLAANGFSESVSMATGNGNTLLLNSELELLGLYGQQARSVRPANAHGLEDPDD